MRRSPYPTAGLTVSTTSFASVVSNATAVTLVAATVPETVNAPVAGAVPLVSRASSKVRVSVAPATAALASVGAVVSGVAFVTAWSVNPSALLPAASTSALSLPVVGTA